MELENFWHYCKKNVNDKSIIGIIGSLSVDYLINWVIVWALKDSLVKVTPMDKMIYCNNRKSCENDYFMFHTIFTILQLQLQFFIVKGLWHCADWFSHVYN